MTFYLYTFIKKIYIFDQGGDQSIYGEKIEKKKSWMNDTEKVSEVCLYLYLCIDIGGYVCMFIYVRG